MSEKIMVISQWKAKQDQIEALKKALEATIAHSKQHLSAGEDVRF